MDSLILSLEAQNTDTLVKVSGRKGVDGSLVRSFVVAGEDEARGAESPCPRWVGGGPQLTHIMPGAPLREAPVGPPQPAFAGP